MHRFFTLALLATTLWVGGCGVVGEERGHAMAKEWGAFSSFNWFPAADEVANFDDILPSPQRKEQLAEQKICEHKNSHNRVVTQDGVNDSVAYRRCALAPYAMDSGSRMGLRPDGNGQVVR